MQLATVDARGRPTIRTVLMKDFDVRGWVFYGNHLSRKGHNLDEQKVAALNFYWPVLGAQVRIEGSITDVTSDEADGYFATRPRLSQLGAWASLQSQALDSRATLEARVDEFTKKFEGQAVPRPAHWSGWRLAPDYIEFWKAHPFRLHWRDIYSKQGDAWVTSMLYP